MLDDSVVTPSFLDLSQVAVETIEASLPELAVQLEPLRHVLQRPRLEPARTPLRRAAARDQACPLEHLQVLRHGGQAHREGLGQLRHGRLTAREAREDLPPRRVCQGGERAVELLRRHLSSSTMRLFNRSVYSTGCEPGASTIVRGMTASSRTRWFAL